VGARQTVILHPLGVGAIEAFDLRDKGVPVDAMILRVAHTAALTEGLGIVGLDATDSARALGISEDSASQRNGSNRS
jgi:hypothetical protein